MQQGTFRGFEVTLDDKGIAVITFNQPERLNGMTQGFKRDLIEILTQAQMDEAVRVVVITGSGTGVLGGRRHHGAPGSGTGRRRSCRTSGRATTPDRHVRGAAGAVADAELGGAEPGQDHDRRDQRRGDPDRPVAGAFVRLPHRLDGGAAWERDAAVRADAGRGRPVPAGAADGRGEDDGLPDAQPDRAGGGGARAGAGARGRVAGAADAAGDGRWRGAGERPAGGDASAQARASTTRPSRRSRTRSTTSRRRRRSATTTRTRARGSRRSRRSGRRSSLSRGWTRIVGPQKARRGRKAQRASSCRAGRSHPSGTGRCRGRRRGLP